MRAATPQTKGLYRPEFEHDACGIGFVAKLQGGPSRRLIDHALGMLLRMEHRGASGAEANTGDGAGILVATPDPFLRRVARQDQHLELPARGRYAAGLVFLPQCEELANRCRDELEACLEELTTPVVGWRPVPTNSARADLGPTALRSMPHIEMVFVVDGMEPSSSVNEGDRRQSFTRRLFAARKIATHRNRSRLAAQGSASDAVPPLFSVCSLAPDTLIYKGMLLPHQLELFYDDLASPDFRSRLGMVHSRFSTNTFPSWDRAQPNRMMSHNGEINTVRGNVAWMSAREGALAHPELDDHLEHMLPIVEPGGSDSGSFDNVLELLSLGGRSIAESVMMMVPEAWQNDHTMDAGRRAFYRTHAGLMEPWDGPASIAFTDGRLVGAVLDRNGLRPSRYQVTRDGWVVMASEVGVVPIEPSRIVRSGRVEPGRMLLIDLDEGRIVGDEEIKGNAGERHPYAQWLEAERFSLEASGLGDVAQEQGRGAANDGAVQSEPLEPTDRLARQTAFGYTVETLRFMLRPLVEQKRDPVGSMGNDAALACLSEQPRLVYDYFKQLFAQVTNPAIDSIREDVVMSLETVVGPQSNLLELDVEHAAGLELEHPLLTTRQMRILETWPEIDQQAVAGESKDDEWARVTLDATWSRPEGEAGLSDALDRITHDAVAAAQRGAVLIILSDRQQAKDHVAIPALLAGAAVHQALLDRRIRTRTILVSETGEAREVHHHALLLGFGVDAIHPYLAYESLLAADTDGRFREGEDTGLFSESGLLARYRAGVGKGLLKVMAKMGISTLASYKGAQIFEAVGLGAEVMDRCFRGCASRLGGVDLATLADEALARHDQGFGPTDRAHPSVEGELGNHGEFHWRAGGERHMWSPTAIGTLQQAARTNDATAYWQFAAEVDETTTRNCALRGLLQLRSANRAIDPDQVEPATEIVRRFATGAMSFGSISAPTHESLAVAMNRLGGKSNTGEGGEDPARFEPLPSGDSKRSAIKQVASGRFGVTGWYLLNADEIQIKIAQGAKPGEGGELPGLKVDEIIARTRHSTPGVGLISPPPHHDIYSIEDLKQLIHDLKNANPAARISVKLVAATGVGTVAAGVVKAYAEHVLISGHDGGTGASPLTSIKHAGLPWEIGLAETHQTLLLNGLRSRVVLQTDGQLKTGRDVVVAAMLGAEEYGFATAPLITLGCVMMRKCHLNTCPVGIATQDPELQQRFKGQPEHVVNYLFMVAEDVRRHLAALGLRSLAEAVGRGDLLEARTAVDAQRTPRRARKIAQLDLTPLHEALAPPHLERLSQAKTTKRGAGFAAGRLPERSHELHRALDQGLIHQAQPLLRGLRSRHPRNSLRLSVGVRNTDRAVGTLLSRAVLESCGEHGLPEGSLQVTCRGSAGQSLGAFLSTGIDLDLIGEANDYVGKGLSGGRITVRPSETAGYQPEDGTVIGNVALYGATSGDLFVRGRAAERFAVRNSGARAVVEGVGDHGCEYMTGGRVVVLGEIGRNFAAGMSGGIAWIWDRNQDVRRLVNTGLVEIESVDDRFEDELFALLQDHTDRTGSKIAGDLVADWPWCVDRFVQVMPVDYRAALERRTGSNAGAARTAGAVA